MHLILNLFLVAVILFTPIFKPNKLYQAPKECQILASIKLDPAESEPMKSVSVSSYLKNCSPLTKTYRVVGGEQSKCGDFRVFADGSVELKAGEGTSLTADCIAAPDNCPGPVTVMIAVYEGETKIVDTTAVLKDKKVVAQR